MPAPPPPSGLTLIDALFPEPLRATEFVMKNAYYAWFPESCNPHLSEIGGYSLLIWFTVDSSESGNVPYHTRYSKT